MFINILDISHNASYVKNPELENSKVYFIAVVSKVFDLPANVITEVESIVRNECNSFRSNKYFNVDIENMTITVMKFVCERHDIKLDVQKIDEFMKKIFPNDKTIR